MLKISVLDVFANIVLASVSCRALTAGKYNRLRLHVHVDVGVKRNIQTVVYSPDL